MLRGAAPLVMKIVLMIMDSGVLQLMCSMSVVTEALQVLTPMHTFSLAVLSDR